MTNHTHVTRSLKQLRERAGLSVREMARRVGMSSSGYLHYESPDRFKDAYLPVVQAQAIAAAFSGTGVRAEEVMALTGSWTPETSDMVRRFGLEENAKPFVLREHPTQDDKPNPLLKKVFGDKAMSPASYLAAITLPVFSIVKGDVLIVDMGRPANAGELTLVSIFDEDSATAVTTVKRYLPPYLGSGLSEEATHFMRIDDPGVTVRYPVIGSIRGLDQD